MDSNIKVEWIEIVQKTDEELRNLTKELDIPADYLTSINDPFEIARMENNQTKNGKTTTLVVLQYLVPNYGKEKYVEYKTRAISIIQTDNRVIVAMPEKPEIYENLFEKLKEKNDLIYEELVMRIFWVIQSECVRVLRWIHEEVEDMQGDIEFSSQNHELYRLMSLDKSLAYIKTAIQNNRIVLEQIYQSDRFKTRMELNELMHDVLIESYQAESMVDEGMRIIDQLSDIFSNVISNNLNNIMKVLTSITIVLTIPTIIGGLWGMNVPVPFGQHDYGFIITTGISVIISVIVIIWLKKKDYL